MSTIGTTLFSKIEINGQEVDIATLDANDGIYALPVGYTTANVKFTMIDNTSIPRGVFEENSYITAMTLPDVITYIASYSFHGVNNINISDKNAILAINPYAFDAEPGPTPPSPTDPDFYFSESNYEITSGQEVSMKNNLTNNTQIDTSQHSIQWTSSSSDIQIKSQTKGTIKSYKAGATGTITATLSDGNDTHTAICTVNVIAAKQTPVGEWYNGGNVINYLDVVQGGSSTYTLTFSGTPNDSWTFSTESTVSGISVDTTNGTITINESNLDSSLIGSGIYINANRPADTTYNEGVGQIYIGITSTPTTKILSVLSNEFVNTNESQTNTEAFTIGHLNHGGRIGAADLVVSYTTTSYAPITIGNVNITHKDWATETDARVLFDLTVGQGVAENDIVSIYAELTDNGSGYSMTNSYVGNIGLIQKSLNVYTGNLNARTAGNDNDKRVYIDIYTDSNIKPVEVYTVNEDYVQSWVQEETYTPDGIYSHKYRIEIADEKGIFDSSTVNCKLIVKNLDETKQTTKDLSFQNPWIQQ